MNASGPRYLGSDMHQVLNNNDEDPLFIAELPGRAVSHIYMFHEPCWKSL